MIRNKIKRGSLLLIATLLFATFAIQLLSPISQGSAKAASSSKLETNIKSYIYYTAWERCMGNGTLSSGAHKDFINTSDAIIGKYFGLDVTDQKPNLGYLQQGSADCSQNDGNGWVVDALRFWGWSDNVAAICELGFKRDNPGTGSNDIEKCINGSENFTLGSDPVTAFKKAVEMKYYGKQGRPTLTAQENYLLYLNTFTASCGGVAQGTVSGASPSLKAIANTDTGYTLDILGPNYEKIPTIYQAQLGKGKNVDVYTGKEANCENVVKEINKDFGTYQTYMVADKATANPKETPPSATPPSSPISSTAAGDTNDGCYKNLPGFGWLLCGVVDLADMAYSWMRQSAFDLLTIPSASINSSKGLHSAWNTTKNLATAGLVLVALIMVASQIFRFDFIDAYTVKKVMPRLVIAAIGIQLSWFIFIVMIQFSNDIAMGLYQLLTSAYGATDIMDIIGSGQSASAGNIVGGASLIGLLTGGAVVAGIFANGGALMIVFTMLGVLISILVAVFTLVVRYMLIIILLVIAPLALLAWILPGTQNLWQTWWKLFSRLLAMFTLITLLFAAGSIGAQVMIELGSSKDANSTLTLVAALVMYFAPLFLLPSTFKFAGGMFTTTANMLNKAGSKAKGYGWMGTKARANESYKENKKAGGLERAASHTGPGLGNRIHRTRGRLAAGTLGASGDYANKLRESELKQDFQNAGIEADSVIKSAGPNYEDQKIARKAILNAKEGSEIDIGGKKVKVTRRLQDATALKAASNKEHGAVRAYHNNTRVVTGTDSAGNTTYDSRVSQLSNTSPEAFGILDKYTPGFSRAGNDGNIEAGFLQTAVNTFGNIGSTDDLDAAGNVVTRSAQGQVADLISTTLQSGNEPTIRQGLGQLTTIARSSDTSDADLALLATNVGISDLSKLRTNANARLDIGPNNKVIIIE